MEIFAEKWSTVPNNTRHHSDAYNFGHMSDIDAWDTARYPDLSQTSPQYFVLRGGDSLLIPKGWWHWVRTTLPSISVNYWWDGSSAQPEHKIGALADWTEGRRIRQSMLETYGKNQQVITWNCIDNSHNRVTLEELFTVHRDFSYLITLNNPAMHGNKSLLLDCTPKASSLPTAFNNFKIEEGERNLWISMGKHCSGMHYDDNDGLLCLIEGEKHIVLVPPSDSHLLQPLPLIPEYATSPSFALKCNMYLRSTTLAAPHARLLYESFIAAQAPKQVQQVPCELWLKMPPHRGRNVFGVKWTGTEIRWEFYHYGFSDTRKERNDMTLVPFTHAARNVFLPTAALRTIYGSVRDYGPSIVSFDVYPREDPIGDMLHVYYQNEEGSRGNAMKIHDNTIFTMWESEWICLQKEGSSFSLKSAWAALQLPAEHADFFEGELGRYEAEDAILTRKLHEGRTVVLLQWCGVSFDSFRQFLEVRKWPQHLRDYCKNELEAHSHEIGELWDVETRAFMRSAFYGAV